MFNPIKIEFFRFLKEKTLSVTTQKISFSQKCNDLKSRSKLKFSTLRFITSLLVTYHPRPRASSSQSSPDNTKVRDCSRSSAFCCIKRVIRNRNALWIRRYALFETFYSRGVNLFLVAGQISTVSLSRAAIAKAIKVMLSCKFVRKLPSPKEVVSKKKERSSL